MKGDITVIELLNEALRNELTAVNQYWLHYRLLDEMIGFEKATLTDHMFAETQGRVIVSGPNERPICEAAERLGLHYWVVGAASISDEAQIVIDPRPDGTTKARVNLADLRAAHEGFFPALMGADAALA